MNWIPDEKRVTVVGQYHVTYCRPGPGNGNTEGAYLVDLGSEKVMVIPDGRNSGQRRRGVILEALKEAERTKIEPLPLLVGHLALVDMSWHRAEPDPVVVKLDADLAERFGVKPGRYELVAR